MSVFAQRPEIALLLCCARTHVDAEKAERIRALVAGGLNWDPLMDLACYHRVIPLLHRHVSDLCPKAVPAPIRQELEELSRANAYRNLLLSAELLKILSLFEAHGIPAIPYKGPVLAASLYGDLSLRQFGDLDILVHERDALRAKDLLLSQGFRTRFSLPPKRSAVFLRRELDFIHDRPPYCVELHWGIIEKHFSFAPDLDRMWERLEPVSLGGTSVLSLSPEDSLLSLCLHGFLHLWQRLSWICDIAEQIRACKSLDWQRFIKQATATGCGRIVSLGLFLANDLLGAEVEEEILSEGRSDRAPGSLAETIRGNLLRYSDQQPSPLRRLYLNLRAIDRTKDKARYFLDRLTPSCDDWDLFPLPAFLFPFYYLLRAVRLAAQYAFCSAAKTAKLSRWKASPKSPAVTQGGASACPIRSASDPRGRSCE